MSDPSESFVPIRVHPTVMLRVDEIRPNQWNPNEETDEEFALLVESIRAEGFIQPVNVCPLEPREGKVKYELIGGEHRWGAARVLGMEEIPGIVLDDYAEDRRKMLTVRMNVLSGKMNPLKFTRMFNDMLRKYQDKAILSKLMGFATEEAFKKVYRDVKQSLPEEFAKKLAESGDEIKTIQDLSLALNRLFTDYGGTLPSNFMVFSYGGREHLMLRCSARTWGLVNEVANRAFEQGMDANVLFAEIMLKGVAETERNEDPPAPLSALVSEAMMPSKVLSIPT